MKRCLTAIVLVLAPVPVAAQAALDCFGYEASALAIPEPWEAYTRTFANGNVRVTLMDTIEPAAGALYLMVQSPPRDEMGNRACAVIASAEGMGFADMSWDKFDASYDPATGLTVRAPVTLHAPATGTGFAAATLAVTINQATGDITPFYE